MGSLLRSGALAAGLASCQSPTNDFPACGTVPTFPQEPLSAHAHGGLVRGIAPLEGVTNPGGYAVYGVAVSEVEVDVTTGGCGLGWVYMVLGCWIDTTHCSDVWVPWVLGCWKPHGRFT